ncbi:MULTISPECIES: LysR family transcriptional regulator [Caballeronia]|jgi:DNA-binding transcriptional LysR family regulator|uniref:LysR family transcriptional regulator n=1 Tax=Caballeronia zhejiangensis TaxID=871203 RepID=A0A656QMD7_9BURK|nr:MULTISPECIES: LysR family transcriptional regulator [Caballeronia]EKS66595.1 LysR family transcriptional regulator [Burkholderia sp. SJ98]KDR30859.1 LysR family transcriptional regulator [Caballeronia zhejiangensis]MCG7400162.1 LysR family transcriptional regulator [Caballeronia zhejiangensis]MCI1042735.1 LysR family transcriptional regulator [Caballeronia zhejiangensis]MDR5768729.1 LysR family transcriptional regulator [Caballeronia sp. LZ028]
MNRTDDPFDTYLLRVLCTLIGERSVSRTAIRMNQSQPAISSALKRLRAIFNDPLLTREKNAMVPTERAIQLAQSAQAALSALDNLLVSDDHFDPATTEQSFTVGMPDYLAPPFFAHVVREFRHAAPRARLIAVPLSASFNYEQGLSEGSPDIVIGNWPNPPEHLHLSVLLEDDVVCVVARDSVYAQSGKFDAQDYLSASHIVPTPYSRDQRGVVDTGLSTMRVHRDNRVSCPYFNLAPSLIPGTDLILTTGRHFANYHAQHLPLVVLDAPIEFPFMRFYQLWHPSRHRSASHVWLRGMLTAAAQELRALRDMHRA